jgi:predicted PurR-regulated permease PerM
VAALCVIAVILSIGALAQAELFAIPTVLAGLIALALAPPARSLERLGLPRLPLAFALVFGSVAGLSAGLYLLAPPLDALTREAPELARQFERSLRHIEAEMALQGGPDDNTNDAAIEQPARGNAEDSDDSSPDEADIVNSGRQYAADVLLRASSLIGPAVYCIFLAGFLLAERATVERALLAAMRTQRTRLFMARFVRRVRGQVATYLLSITMINVVLGLATALLFWLLDVEGAAAWGAAMCLLNFIPYLGPVIMNAAVFVAGILTTPDLGDALVPVGALMVLNTIEGYFVTPRVVGHRVQLGALSVFLGVAFGAWLWGAPGALIATPALIVIRTFFVVHPARV